MRFWSVIPVMEVSTQIVVRLNTSNSSRRESVSDARKHAGRKEMRTTAVDFFCYPKKLPLSVSSVSSRGISRGVGRNKCFELTLKIYR